MRLSTKQMKNIPMNRTVLMLIFLFCINGLVVHSQNDTVFNQVNEKGQKIGFWKKTINDTLVFEGYFENGYPLGEMKRYYYDGKNIRAKLVYSNQGKNAEALIYHYNGNLMSEGKYVNQQKQGHWKFYDYYGNIISEVDFVNDKKNGKEITYYPDSTIAEEGYWKMGIEDGKWKTYYTDGKTKRITTLKDGKMDGLMLLYYPNGVVNLSGMYKNNLKHGKWLWFDEKGLKIQEEDYENGQLINKVIYQEDKSPDKQIEEDSKLHIKNRGNSNSENGPGETPYQ